jgi:hypothetical protein
MYETSWRVLGFLRGISQGVTVVRVVRYVIEKVETGKPKLIFRKSEHPAIFM